MKVLKAAFDGAVNDIIYHLDNDEVITSKEVDELIENALCCGTSLPEEVKAVIAYDNLSHE